MHIVFRMMEHIARKMNKGIGIRIEIMIKRESKYVVSIISQVYIVEQKFTCNNITYNLYGLTSS